MNKHAYVTVIRLLGKLLVRSGLYREPGFGGGFDHSEISYLQQALEEYKFYASTEERERILGGEAARSGNGEGAVPTGRERKSARASERV